MSSGLSGRLDPERTLSPLDDGFDDRAFPGMASRDGSISGSVPGLDQAEALEAANAIDAVMRKRSEPVHERLRDSIINTLRSRAKIMSSLSGMDVAGIASQRGFRTGLLPNESGYAGMATRSFGKSLAASWTSLPDTGMDGGRSKVLEKLDGTAAARVRGLLTHLEFAVQADPGTHAAGLLNVSPGAMPWYEGPPPPSSPLLPGYGEDDEAESSPIVATLPQEDPWPYERFRMESRGRHCEGAAHTRISGSAAQRLMSFRENLMMAYSSLGEAFASIDMDGRGCISFDHFHAHLVRLKLSRCDAEGTLRAVELFKLLDANQDDLITPNDCLRSFEAAAREIRTELRKVETERKFTSDAYDHGYTDGGAHVRFDKLFMLTGDDALRIATLRRFFELQGSSLITGLDRLDVGHTGFLRKEAFICGLIEQGYCVSASEAMDLFQVMDVHKVGSLSLRYLEKLDQGERLGAALPEHRPEAGPRGGSTLSPGATAILQHPAGHQLRSGIGSGGLFSDPGRLDGPRPPPRPHARYEQLRDWDPDELPQFPVDSRRPLIGDAIVSKSGGQVTMKDVDGNLNGWVLKAGETATVMYVKDHGRNASVDQFEVRLENPSKKQSAPIRRSDFLFKPDIYVRLHSENTIATTNQKYGKKQIEEVVIIDDLLSNINTAAKAKAKAKAAAKQKFMNQRGAFDESPSSSRRRRGDASPRGQAKPRGVSSREARTADRSKTRNEANSPPRSASPRKRGETPPAASGPSRSISPAGSGRQGWQDQSPRNSPRGRSLGGGLMSSPRLVGGGKRPKPEVPDESASSIPDENETAFSLFLERDNAASGYEASPLSDELDGCLDLTAMMRKEASNRRKAKLRSAARIGTGRMSGFVQPMQGLAQRRASKLSKTSDGSKENEEDENVLDGLLNYVRELPDRLH